MSIFVSTQFKLTKEEWVLCITGGYLFANPWINVCKLELNIDVLLSEKNKPMICIKNINFFFLLIEKDGFLLLVKQFKYLGANYKEWLNYFTFVVYLKLFDLQRFCILFCLQKFGYHYMAHIL